MVIEPNIQWMEWNLTFWVYIERRGCNLFSQADFLIHYKALEVLLFLYSMMTLRSTYLAWKRGKYNTDTYINIEEILKNKIFIFRV